MQRSPLVLVPYPTFPAISLALMWLVKGHILFQEIKAVSGGGFIYSPPQCAAAATATAAKHHNGAIPNPGGEPAVRSTSPTESFFFSATFVSGRSIKCLPLIRSQSHFYFFFFLLPLAEVDHASADYPALIKPAQNCTKCFFLALLFFKAAQKLFCFLMK